MYFDYLDIRLAEKRMEDKKSENISLNDFFKDLGADVHN